jgi:hypothetical protein
MKSSFFKILFFLFFLLINYDIVAQDIIVRSNNDSIKCKVIEITVDKIKFKYNNLPNERILEIHKNEVRQIIYENGSKLTIVYNPYEVSRDLMIPQRSIAMKIDLLAPLLNHFTVGYEIKIKTGRNLEIKGGFIGTNINTGLKHVEGYFVKAGVKFVKLTHSYMKGLKYVQPVAGSYLKPELTFGQFKRDEDFTKINYTNYVVSIIFGKQKVFNNRFTFDYFGGVGYGHQASTSDKQDIDFNYAYSHLFFGKKIPIIITGGITAGIVY